MKNYIINNSPDACEEDFVLQSDCVLTLLMQQLVSFHLSMIIHPLHRDKIHATLGNCSAVLSYMKLALQVGNIYKS